MHTSQTRQQCCQRENAAQPSPHGLEVQKACTARHTAGQRNRGSHANDVPMAPAERGRAGAHAATVTSASAGTAHTHRCCCCKT